MNNVKLIATDMGHTLLTEKGELPSDFGSCVYLQHAFSETKSSYKLCAYYLNPGLSVCQLS